MILPQTRAQDPRREAYQLNSADSTAFGSWKLTPAEMLVESRDASGRRLWEVVQSAIETVTANVSITRVDFFVKYPRADSDVATVRINEVVSPDMQSASAARRRALECVYR